MTKVYRASPIRLRATQAELQQRERFLIDYATEHYPVTVRQLFYAATVAGLVGIEKNENGYRKIQNQILKLRQSGRLAYNLIADHTRWMRKSQTYGSVADAVIAMSQSYRKALWADSDYNVEVWLEKDALAGAINSVTDEYDVPLMVTKGFCSETFAYEAAQLHAESDKRCVILYLGDFDRAGVDAMHSLHSKLRAFADESGADMHFIELGVTPEQIEDWNLPTREPKRQSAADKKWPHSFACELDAIPPNYLRDLVLERRGRTSVTSYTAILMMDMTAKCYLAGVIDTETNTAHVRSLSAR